MLTFSAFRQIHEETLEEASQDQLDISILNIDKLKPEQLSEWSNKDVVVTEKTDGSKMSVFRTAAKFDPNDYTKNWIVAYKGHIINPEDVHAASDEEVRNYSTGISQYKIIFDAIKKNHKNTKFIKPNTEIFCEFIQRKPTLSRQYEKYHGVVVLASSPITYSVKGGMIFSKGSTFDTSQREEIASALEFTTPRILFEGKLSKFGDIEQIKKHFLSIPSQWGGKMEGVVIEDGQGGIIKIVQPDQYDKDMRAKIKAKMAPIDETKYWDVVKRMAVDIMKDIDLKQPLNKILHDVSAVIYKANIPQVDPNKKDINFKDDLFLTVKGLVQRQMFRGALFISRFSPMTIAHHKILADALRQYDSVTVAIVKAASSEEKGKSPFPVELQKEMIEKCFGDKIEVLIMSTGNISTILQKSHNLISYVLAGSDRVAGYEAQLKHDDNIHVVEIPRTDDVSATVVRDALKADDFEKFKKYAPPCIHDMYEALKGFV